MRYKSIFAHDDNCNTYIFECACGEKLYNPQAQCPGCDWKGNLFCNIGHGPDGLHFTPLSELPYNLGVFILNERRERAIAEEMRKL